MQSPGSMLDSAQSAADKVNKWVWVRSQITYGSGTAEIELSLSELLEQYFVSRG